MSGLLLMLNGPEARFDMRKSYAASLIVCALISITTAAHASNWIQIATTHNGSRLISIDIDSIKEDSGYVAAWTKKDLKHPIKLPGGKLYDSTKLHMLFDCSGRRTQIEYAAYYLKGESVDYYSEKLSPSGFDETIPDSVGEAELNAACRVIELDRQLKKENDEKSTKLP